MSEVSGGSGISLWLVNAGRFASVVSRGWSRIGASWRTLEVQKSAIIGKNTRFGIEGNVSNIFGDRNRIIFGNSCVCRGEIQVFAHGGRVNIGNHTYIGPNSTIWSAHDDGIIIGNRVLISINVHIHDTDGHPNARGKRAEQTISILEEGHPRTDPGLASAPVRIADDVWVGVGSIILKGITLGEGCIVGAGSVVTRDVTPYTVVAGNPARVVRTLESRPE